VLTGPGGAGKTTALRGLLGLTPCTGEVRVMGAPPGDPAALRRVGYAPQARPAAGGLTCHEAVAAVARLRGAAPGEAGRALRRAGLGPASGARRTEGLDVEEARRLGLALAIAGAPLLLVLDDPWEFPETMRQIADARARGGAVLVATDEPAGFPAAVGPVVALGPEGRPA
jgi:ABC-type multidrug transport system ATPase subunit